MDTEQIIEALKQERNRISQAIAVLEGNNNPNVSLNHAARQRRGPRHMSAEARARIAAAQRRRWAAVKARKKK